MPLSLDLGCGSTKRGDVGVDIAPGPAVDHVLALGFDNLPFADNTFDRVFMVHAIEHVPFMVWTVTGVRTYPMVQLLSEVYRVMKPGASFEILTLEFPDPRCVEDPTHCSYWTRETIKHFVGCRDTVVANDNDYRAGLRVPFHLERSGLTTDGLLEIILRK